MYLRTKLTGALIGLMTITIASSALGGPSSSQCNLMLSLNFPVMGCATSEQSVISDHKKRALLVTIPFTNESKTLTESAKKILDTEIAPHMFKNTDKKYRIFGHGNRIESARFKEDLSLMRAKSIADYLQKRHGIEVRRLEVKGRGANNPLPNVAPTSSAQQRVEILEMQ